MHFEKEMFFNDIEIRSLEYWMYGCYPVKKDPIEFRILNCQRWE